MRLAALELDLEVFSGPFDLLLTLVLREEVDLLELQLAEVVLAYLDHLEQRGELDLEAATEFIVLIAALLELKSRLMLTGEEGEELLEIEPGEAAEELLARMLDARRYRAASAHLGELLEAEHGVRFRSAPLPANLRRAIVQPAEGSQDPLILGEAIGRLLLMAPTISLRHIAVSRVTVAERLAHLRGLLRRGAFSFDEAVRGADRVTVAVTLFALLELYKQGEADWEQGESFGEIAIRAPRRSPTRAQKCSAWPAPGDGGVSEAADAQALASAQPALALAHTIEALLFLSNDPLSVEELTDATQAGEGAVLAALELLAEGYAPGRRGIRLRELGGGWTLSSDPAAEEAARRLFSRARASTLTPAQAETLAIVAYLQPVSRPEITRIRGVSADSAVATLLDRGLIEEAGHSQFGAVLYRTSTQFLKLFGLRTLQELPDIARWDPTPEEQAELRERLLRAGEARLSTDS